MATVPVSDERWSQILEEVGLIDHHPHPARACELSSWHYCPACRWLRPVDRVAWWPDIAECQNGNAMVGNHPSDHFHTSATAKEWR
jgi:hypothetical protein